MHGFTYYSPTKVIFGQGTVSRIIPELQAANVCRVLLLTGGNSVHASGLYGTVTGLLDEAKITWTGIGGVQPNPRLSKVREAVAAGREMQAQAILAVGGGSVFDSAKAVAFGAVSDQDVWDVFAKRLPVTKALPIYGVVTLSGTSSEVNETTVISNEETHEKLAVAHAPLFPRAVIVDPELQYSVPLAQIRHCGVDALSHILETCFLGLDTATTITEHCEAYCRGIIRCLGLLPGALHDYGVRSELAFCSTYTHSGWASVGRSKRGDFSSHRIGHALGGLYDTPHGVTLGIIMPAWMRYAYDQNVSRDAFARLATHVFGLAEAPGGDFALAAITALKDFVRSLDMPVSMRELGVTEADIPALAANAAASLPFGGAIPMNLERITAVLKLAL